MAEETAAFPAVGEIELTYKTKVKAIDRPKIKSSHFAQNLFRQVYPEGLIYLKEFFYVAYLNKRNVVLAIMKLSEGARHATVVDTLHILAPALMLNASGIVLCHNHPSDNTTPSEADFLLTERCKQACKIFSITLLDHIILTSNDYYSFSDNGKLEP